MVQYVRSVFSRKEEKGKYILGDPPHERNAVRGTFSLTMKQPITNSYNYPKHQRNRS